MILASLFLMLGPRTLLLVLFAVILLFGGKKLPELFRGVGQGVREFKDATKEEKPEFRDRPVNPNDPTKPRL